MRIIIVVAFLIGMATMACAPSATTSESESNTSPEQSRESSPSLLLDEQSAIGILQGYLQECTFGWDKAYAKQMAERHQRLRTANARSRRFAETWGTLFPTSTPPRRFAGSWGTVFPTLTSLPPESFQLPQSEQQKKSWLMDLATGTIRDMDWSARHIGIAEVPGVFSRKGTAVEVESWVVVGPGLQRVGGESVVTQGRWQVYAGHQRADYLDVPARLAQEMYNKYGSCPRDPRYRQ